MLAAAGWWILLLYRFLILFGEKKDDNQFIPGASQRWSARLGWTANANAKSCPDLETMILNSGMRIPGTGGMEQFSPKLQRHRNRHGHIKGTLTP